MPRFRHLAPLLLLLVAACKGNYSGGTDGAGGTGGTGGTGGGSQQFANDTQLFNARVAPNLGFCRSCHVPGGVADTDKGRRMMLSANSTQDYANLKASWDRLGKGVDTNLILQNASGQHVHSGGAPWPPDSATYKAVRILFVCWNDPAACTAALGNVAGGTPPSTFPLLGSARGGHYWDAYCEGKPDETPVPPDPRTLVVPGVNQGKAVYMNAYWQTCQADDHPGTCGGLRQRVARGYPIVASDGEVGAGHFFGGNYSSGQNAFPASAYANMWQSVMGLTARPDNFDQLVAERWGMPLSKTSNPYPLAGENPNDPAHPGGTGQLPMGVTQLRNADGTWTGNLNVTCSICHGGGVGTISDGPGLGPQYGTNSISDITVMFTDLGRLAPQQGALAVVSQNKVRGTGNITNFQLFGTLEIGSLAMNGNPSAILLAYTTIQGEPSSGTEDPPVWWNVGHRTMKFFDGGQVMDSKRIELSFHFPNVPNHGFPPGATWEADKQWILDHQQDSDAWITSLRSPAWPAAKLGAINVPLAEQGAILFHSKNLWDPVLNNPVPQPDGGNGSCASCHGAYSPRYVNDPAYLDTPLFEGLASYIVPIEVIGTDSKRLDANSQRIADATPAAWFGYSDGPYQEGSTSLFNPNGIPLCGNWNDVNLRGDRRLGYLAPPLYGVWATAPYFHNGAVPSAWEVLKPSDRKTIWRRVSNEARADQAGSVVMGFRTDLAAYDSANLGWIYDELACGTGSTPFIDCNPADDDGATLQDALSQIWGHGGLAWNLLNPPIMNNVDIEARKVYNTNYYSQDNAGHEFTSVLTDQERRAIIEYLKTL